MSIDPATGEVWHHWPAISDTEVVTAVARARAAQPEWAARSLGDRGRILRRFRHLLFDRRAETAALIERDAGLRECVRETALVVDPFPSWRQPWWFGYGAEHAGNIDAFARFWHGRSLRERLSGVWRSVKLLLRGERSFDFCAPGPKLHTTDLHR